MGAAFALVFAASAPVVLAGQAGPQPVGGASATAVASATILRADTSSPDGGPGASARQVRREPNGQVLIEFY